MKNFSRFSRIILCGLIALQSLPAAAIQNEIREVKSIVLPAGPALTNVMPSVGLVDLPNAVIPQFSQLSQAEASAAQAPAAPSAIATAEAMTNMASLQRPDANTVTMSNEAGARFDLSGVKAEGGDALRFDPAGAGSGNGGSNGGSQDDAFLGSVLALREPGEMLTPTDALDIGRKLALSQQQTWETVGRLGKLGYLAVFSNGGSLVVDMPKVDPVDQPAVEARADAVKAVQFINSHNPADHLRAAALLTKAYLKLPSDSDEPEIQSLRKQVVYLRLNAALEAVRDAIDAEENKQQGAGQTHKSLIAEAKTYFYGTYYDLRHVPTQPSTSVTELASDAVGRFDLQSHRSAPDFALIEKGFEVAKTVSRKPAPEKSVAPSLSPEADSTSRSRALALVPASQGGLPAKAPIMALNGVWFPDTHKGVKLTVEGREARLTLSKAAVAGGYMIASTFAGGNKHHKTATLVKISNVEKEGDKTTAVFDVVATVDIAGLEKDKAGTEYATVSYPTIAKGNAKKLEGLAATAKTLLSQFGSSNEEIKPWMISKITDEQKPELVANLLGQHIPFPTAVKQAMLSARTLEERLETGVMELMGMVRGQWSSSKNGPGEGDASAFPEDIDALNARMEKIGMPPAVRKVATEEFNRLQEMSPRDSEGQKVRTYVSWLLDLPWVKRAEDHYDPAEAKRIMEEGHTGLQDVKDRIQEFLAVRKLTGSKKGAVILFVGPKGTGKTSITAKIAKALGRPMVRLSLGGIRDVTDLKGHNRTYLGSQPGAIAKLMKEAGVNNPVFLLDEIDKMDDDAAHGGAKASLLETLDPKQNDTFRDTYLEVPYDLSNVLWIVTANTLDTIPEPLRDRMEIIEFAGYTPIEKLGIAKNHVIPEKAVENGLKADQVQVTDDALKFIIEGYTHEAGVRKLYEQIDKLFRKISAWSLTRNEPIPAVIDKKDVRKYLGVERFHLDDTMSNGVGIMTGLAVTGDVGGSTLNIEVVATPGKGELKITGNLKQVMTESTQAAYTFVKSRAKELGIPAEAFNKLDIHVHFPDGATPKDGPSAGLVIASAIASRITGRPLKPGYAMTGEISLTGQALPIGGLPQKTMGAHRAGMHTVIFPEANKKDLEKIPGEVMSEIELVPVKTADEVLALLLEAKPTVPPAYDGLLTPEAKAAPTASGFVWWKPWTWFQRAK
jgi:ATP-dependent Lon protease